LKSLKTFVAALALVGAVGAHAEVELSIYSGIQASPHNTIKDPNGTEFTGGWEGKSFAMPPYYGFRYTNWTNKEWGWNVNFVHAKAYSNDKTRDVGGYKILEFTDGANPLTVNIMRRFNKTEGGLTPYAGFGAGISIPHVELQRVAGSANTKETFGFQYGGPVLAGTVGFTYPINDKLNLMTEYSMHYLMLNVKMEGEPAGNDRFKTNLITNAINIGVNYKY
jgi:lipid A oxidase